jgi:hypothetical protein
LGSLAGAEICVELPPGKDRVLLTKEDERSEGLISSSAAPPLSPVYILIVLFFFLFISSLSSACPAPAGSGAGGEGVATTVDDTTGAPAADHAEMGAGGGGLLEPPAKVLCGLASLNAAIWERRRKFGMRALELSGSFVIGDVLFDCSQYSMADRSYVWPSHVTTGSAMSSCK